VNKSYPDHPEVTNCQFCSSYGRRIVSYVGFERIISSNELPSNESSSLIIISKSRQVVTQTSRRRDKNNVHVHKVEINNLSALVRLEQKRKFSLADIVFVFVFLSIRYPDILECRDIPIGHVAGPIGDLFVETCPMFVQARSVRLYDGSRFLFHRCRGPETRGGIAPY